jgi:acetyl/propionyl-CoA carboxylase alpha subunit
MISRLLMANRAEIASRVFRSCRRLGIETVAVHSDADADLPYVREADHAVRLPGSTTPRNGLASTRSTRATASCPRTQSLPGPSRTRA